MYKNFLYTGISGRVSNVILRRTLHVIFGCLSNVILNHLSNVIFKHLSNVILGFIPRIHVKSTPMDPRDGLFVTPEDDKGLECFETAESGVDKVVSSCEKNPNCT